MFRASYDFNLGYTLSFGLGIAYVEGGAGKGPYIMYSYSKKGQKFNNINLFQKYLQPKSGSNLSFGLFAGLGIGSFRVGVNRMLFKEESERLWGVEGSGQMVFFNWVAGAMYNNESKKIKPNIGFGFGIF